MRSAASKSAMTPSRIGLMAVMLPGVRPSISFASLPTASICALTVLNATMEGSLRTMPRPRANTQVLAVPRSIARSFEKTASAPSSTEASVCERFDRVYRLIKAGLYGDRMAEVQFQLTISGSSLTDLHEVAPRLPLQDEGGIS